MTQTDFLSTKQLEKAVTRRKKNAAGLSVNWLHIQWIRFVIDKPHVMLYKETLDEDMPFEELVLPPSKHAKQSFSKIKQRRLYSAPRPVTLAKKNDLIDLLPYIPPVNHEFFTSLKTSKEVDDTGPLESYEEENDTNFNDSVPI